MKRIKLTADDLEYMLALVNDLNPLDEDNRMSGWLFLVADNSSGIGQSLDAEIPMKCAGHEGMLRINVSGIEDW